MLTIQFLCPLPNGLHARPAWELKEQCSQWQSEITFINHRQNAKADAKSSLALIGTGTLFNDSCSLNISGSDEEQARRVLEEYIQVRFIDSDSVQPTLAELTAHPLPRSLSRLNPDLLYGNVLASGVGVGTLTLLQSDSLDSYRVIPASAQDSTLLEHSLATLAEQLNQQLRERDGESKTILSAHLSLIQDDEFAGNIRHLMAEQHQGLGAAIISNMEQICAKLSASASDYLRERVSDIRDISEQLLHITWPELKPRNNLVLEKPTILVAEDLTPSQFLSLDLKNLAGMILEKTGRTSHTLILARASAIPVLSGLPLDAIARYAGQPAVLDAQCGVLAINPNDAVSGYYQVAQTLADKRQKQQAQLPRSWPIPVIKSVLILRRILAQLWKPQARLPTARKALGCFVPKCSIWIATARRTSRNSLKRTSRCYWRRATSRLSSARWTSVAIKAFLTSTFPRKRTRSSAIARYVFTRNLLACSVLNCGRFCALPVSATPS